MKTIICNLTTPNDMRISPNCESEIMAKMFEKELKNKNKGKNFYHLIIQGEYSKQACQIIENSYKLAGWSNAICESSSENDERGALTGLQLFI